MVDYVLKIGGSVLTDKKEEEKLSSNFSSILEALSDHPDGVIVHGAGSYGHPSAKKHGIAEGSKTGILETHSSIKRLNEKVVEELRNNGVKTLPIHPLSASYRNPETNLMIEQVLKTSEEGFTPVIHGDAIITEGKGATVISGDEIVPTVEQQAQTGKVGFCTSTPGVFDENGEIMDEINSMKQFHEHEIEGVDVSGGMKNKLEEIFEHGINARIFGQEDLEAFLKGKEVGTLVKGR